MLLDEVARQQWYIFPAVPQRRNVQWKNMQAIIKVGAKLVFLNHCLQIAICGGDQTCIGADRAITAYTLKFLVLNGAQ